VWVNHSFSIAKSLGAFSSFHLRVDDLETKFQSSSAKDFLLFSGFLCGLFHVEQSANIP
jgi:hypothetical protein